MPAPSGLSRNNLLKNFRRRRSELLLDTENSTTDTATGYNEALKGVALHLSFSLFTINTFQVSKWLQTH